MIFLNSHTFLHWWIIYHNLERGRRKTKLRDTLLFRHRYDPLPPLATLLRPTDARRATPLTVNEQHRAKHHFDLTVTCQLAAHYWLPERTRIYRRFKKSTNNRVRRLFLHILTGDNPHDRHIYTMLRKILARGNNRTLYRRQMDKKPGARFRASFTFFSWRR